MVKIIQKAALIFLVFVISFTVIIGECCLAAALVGDKELPKILEIILLIPMTWLSVHTAVFTGKKLSPVPQQRRSN